MINPNSRADVLLTKIIEKSHSSINHILKSKLCDDSTKKIEYMYNYLNKLYTSRRINKLELIVDGILLFVTFVRINPLQKRIRKVYFEKKKLRNESSFFRPDLEEENEKSIFSFNRALLSEITVFLTPKDLLNLSLTCKNMYQKTSNNIIWEIHLERLLNENKDAKGYYTSPDDKETFRKVCNYIYLNRFHDLSSEKKDLLMGYEYIFREEAIKINFEIIKLTFVPALIISLLSKNLVYRIPKLHKFYQTEIIEKELKIKQKNNLGQVITLMQTGNLKYFHFYFLLTFIYLSILSYGKGIIAAIHFILSLCIRLDNFFFVNFPKTNYYSSFIIHGFLFNTGLTLIFIAIKFVIQNENTLYGIIMNIIRFGLLYVFVLVCCFYLAISFHMYCVIGYVNPAKNVFQLSKRGSFNFYVRELEKISKLTKYYKKYLMKINFKFHLPLLTAPPVELLCLLILSTSIVGVHFFISTMQLRPFYAQLICFILYSHSILLFNAIERSWYAIH